MNCVCAMATRIMPLMEDNRKRMGSPSKDQLRRMKAKAMDKMAPVQKTMTQDSNSWSSLVWRISCLPKLWLPPLLHCRYGLGQPRKLERLSPTVAGCNFRPEKKNDEVRTVRSGYSGTWISGSHINAPFIRVSCLSKTAVDQMIDQILR